MLKNAFFWFPFSMLKKTIKWFHTSFTKKRKAHGDSSAELCGDWLNGAALSRALRRASCLELHQAAVSLRLWDLKIEGNQYSLYIYIYILVSIWKLYENCGFFAYFGSEFDCIRQLHPATVCDHLAVWFWQRLAKSRGEKSAVNDQWLSWRIEDMFAKLEDPTMIVTVMPCHPVWIIFHRMTKRGTFTWHPLSTTKWGHPVISWFTSPCSSSCRYHKP